MTNDFVNGPGNGQFYLVGVGQVDESLAGIDTFGQLSKGFAQDEIFAETAVIAVPGKEGRLIVP